MDDCVPTTLLLAALARGRALEARIAELSRPKHPGDYGVQGMRITPIEEAILMALLPPGEVMHRDALIARAWPDVAGGAWCRRARTCCASN